MPTISTLPHDDTSGAPGDDEQTINTEKLPGADGSNVADAAHAAVEQAADLASSAADRVQDGVTAVRSTLDLAIDEVCDYGADCTYATRQAVRARPITAMLLTLAAGLLIGRLSR